MNKKQPFPAGFCGPGEAETGEYDESDFQE